MNNFGALDWTILIVYFLAMASIGPIFARRNKSTEGYFVGDRSFPAWLLGLALFATSISSVTVVAFPADAYKTAYLRLLPNFMLPLGIFIAAKYFLPYFRRNNCTSAFEFLEDRFGTGVRTYVSCAFLLGQIMRISTILYLVSLVFEQITGQSPYVCIVLGGVVIAIYTVAGGMRAIVTAQFIQTFLLWFGAILCFVMVVHGIPGGLATIIHTGLADHKISVADRITPTGPLVASPWFSLRDKAILMMLFSGLIGWLGEYSSNQNTIQKYVSAKDPREATKSIWICAMCSVPTWTFFMFLGTALYVFFKVHPDTYAAAILAGTGKAKAESILPYFCVHNIPTGVLGLVVTGILSAAMSASASSVNAISAVGVTDIYRRHLVKNRDERHYVLVARLITLCSALLMMVGAALYYAFSNLTLQDTGAKLGALLSGGIFGIYILGFFTKRGNGKSVLAGVSVAILWSLYFALTATGHITKEWYVHTFGMSNHLADIFVSPVHVYYVGLFGHLIMFVVAYTVARIFGHVHHTAEQRAAAG